MKVTVIGLGPGAGADLTGRAREALAACDLVVGYTAYVALIKDEFPDKEYRSTGMRKEVDRCRAAVEAAVEGHDVPWCAPATPACTCLLYTSPSPRD